jgi:hypothetical protein
MPAQKQPAPVPVVLVLALELVPAKILAGMGVVMAMVGQWSTTAWMWHVYAQCTPLHCSTSCCCMREGGLASLLQYMGVGLLRLQS